MNKQNSYLLSHALLLDVKTRKLVSKEEVGLCVLVSAGSEKGLL
jgi:hypothetical protein